MLQDDGVQLNENRYLLSSITKGCHYRNHKVKARLPIKKNLMQLIYVAIENVFSGNQPFLIALHRAILVTAYYSMFHIGELTRSQYAEHTVKALDVNFGKNKS